MIDLNIEVVRLTELVIAEHEGHAEDGDPKARTEVVNALARREEAIKAISSAGLIDFAIQLRHGKDGIDGDGVTNPIFGTSHPTAQTLNI
jgi:hypothetical protein